MRRVDGSDKLAYTVLGVIVMIFGAVEFHEVFEQENVYGAFDNISRVILKNCSYESFPFNRGAINWYLVCAGTLSFDNTRLMPFMISLGIIPVTFLTVRKYSNNLTALLVTSALSLDLTFLVFDTVPAFMQTWTIFFLASAYFIRKSPILAGACFWLACLSKILAIAWVPVMVWIILKTKRNRKKNLIAVLSILPVFAISLEWLNGFTFYSGWPFVFEFTWDRFQLGLYWLDQAFRWEKHLLAFLPVIIGYYFYQKRIQGIISFTPYLVALFGVASVFLTAYFTKEGYFPYRLIPNIVMILYGYAYTIRHAINGYGLKS